MRPHPVAVRHELFEVAAVFLDLIRYANSAAVERLNLPAKLCRSRWALQISKSADAPNLNAKRTEPSPCRSQSSGF